MVSDVETLRLAGIALRRRRAVWARIPRWRAEAWAAIALALAFVATSCYWLSRDSAIPVFDAGLHLLTTLEVHASLARGRLSAAFDGTGSYPPLSFLVGALGVFVGGVSVAAPIVALNVVFVALLALGCYQVGRLAFGPLAGALAVVFALGTPLIVEEFHEFMLDAPEAAMVAVSLWAILASERFTRVRVCAVAGALVGLGMLSKETFVVFVAGAVLVSVLRGGRRAWRGVAAFAAVAAVIALPWYLHRYALVHSLTREAVASSIPDLPAGIAPPRLSRLNLEWYLWSWLNWQLLVPLFAFFAVGALWLLVGFVRRRPVSGYAPELACGAFVGWLGVTMTYVHDLRYGLPILVYLAVLGAGWIARLPAAPRVAFAAALCLVALANVLGVGFGVGAPVIAGPVSPVYEQQPGRLTFYSNYGVWVGPPARDGDLLGLLRALHREGAREVRWYPEQQNESEFSFQGITALARIAGLTVPSSQSNPASAARSYAFIHAGEAPQGVSSPCTVLSNGAGVWVRLGSGSAGDPWSYCPSGGS